MLPFDVCVAFAAAHVVQKSLLSLNLHQLKSASHFIKFLFIPLFGGGDVTLKLSLSPGEVTLELSLSALVDGSCCTTPLEVEGLPIVSSINPLAFLSLLEHVDVFLNHVRRDI